MASISLPKRPLMLPFLLLLLVALCSYASQDAWAAAPTFQQAYKAGVKHAYKKKFKAAIRSFQSAFGILQKEDPQTPEKRKALAIRKQKLLYILARTHQLDDAPVQALRYFQRCRRLLPKTREAGLAKKRIDVLQTRVLAKVSIATTPPGAALILRPAKGAVVQGKTPYKAYLRPGSYQATITKVGFQSSTLSLALRAGSSVEKQVLLRPGGVKLTLSTTPKGASVSVVDSKGKTYSGTTPFSLQLSPGSLRLSISKDGYAERKELLTLRVGQSAKKHFALTLRTTLLELRSEPPGARVEIRRKGGKTRRGVTPWKASVPPGQLSIQVRLPGHQPIAEAIALPSGGQIKRSYRLVRTGASPQKILGWSALGLAVAAGIGGGVLFGLAGADLGSAAQLQKERRPTADVLAQSDAGNLKQAIGGVLFGVAGAAAVTGVVLLVLQSRSANTAKTSSASLTLPQGQDPTPQPPRRFLVSGTRRMFTLAVR